MTGSDDCVFCRVVRGDFGTDFVAENEVAVAFHDVHPQAPTHILVVPRRHVGGLRDLGPSDAELAGRLLLLAKEAAQRAGLHEGGYRVIVNDGADGGQTVYHLHLHVLGGRPLGALVGRGDST